MSTDRDRIAALEVRIGHAEGKILVNGDRISKTHDRMDSFPSISIDALSPYDREKFFWETVTGLVTGLVGVYWADNVDNNEIYHSLTVDEAITLAEEILARRDAHIAANSARERG